MLQIQRQSFPKAMRLLDKKEFGRVFERAKRWQRGGVTLLACAGSTPYPRLGLAISKKQVRRAVDRNRLKRLARESFRQAQDTLGSVDIVLLVRGEPKRVLESMPCSLKNLWPCLNG